jgi:dolichyl-phosphate-mannose-protein mannosyltransferase
VAAAVRLLVAGVYRPALFYSDSWAYVDMAYGHHLADDRPAGYPALLALVALPGRSLLAVTTLQHLAGLAVGTLSYLLLRRLGIARWIATAAAGVILVDAYAVTLEQTILAEAFFALALVLSAFLVAGERRGDLAIAASGLVLAGAAMTRPVALFAVPVWLAYVILRHRRPRTLALAACAVLLPLLVYAAAYDRERGSFGLTAAQGWFLYGRVGEIADCSKFRPPPGTGDLCQPASEREGRGPGYFLWSGNSPANRRYGQPGDQRAADAVLGRYAKAVIRARPLAYAQLVGRDFARYFEPGVGSGGGSDDAISLPATPRTGAPTINEAYRARYFSDYRPAPHGAAGVARLYGTVVHPPRPLLALLVLATLAALAMAAISRGRYVVERWPEAFLLTGMAVAMLVGSTATSAFIVRYLVPAVPLIVCGGTLALVDLWRVRAGSGDHDRSRRTSRSARA